MGSKTINRTWLVKSEPSAYSYDQFLKDKSTAWTGVRNYQARNFLREMKRGDIVLYYHSNENKEIVGSAKVSKEWYPDPTATDGDWVCIDLVPVKKLKRPVTLKQLKAEPGLENLLLIKQSRLSVMPLTDVEFEIITQLGNA